MQLVSSTSKVSVLAELKDWDPEAEEQIVGPDDSADSSTVRTDRNDESGNVIGYCLTTETEWFTMVENYDLDNNLISGTYTDLDGYSYSHSSSWESVFDSDGRIAGRRHIAISSDDSYSDSRVEIYDTEGNLLSSTYSSTHGDWETSTRTASPEILIGPVPLSHALKILGAWADGTTYERLETYNIYGQLVSSESASSDGSSENYIIEPVFSEDGIIKGYQGSWSCTDQNGETLSFTEHFDSDLNPIWEPVAYPMPTPFVSDGEDGSSLDHYFAESKSLQVLDSSLEPHRAYAFRGLSPMDESVETDHPLAADPEEPLAIGEAEPLTISEEESVGWSADGTANGDFISSSSTPRTLATTASIQPYITSEFFDLKLNVREHKNATHGKLLGGLDLALRGNNLDNYLSGNTGDNRIAGGRGKDLITGGGGGDQFTFRNRRRSFDTITDFNAADDQFLLRGRVFRDLFTSSGLRKEAIGSSLIHDQTTGFLLYSPNADGANPRSIKLALLPGLEASDFSADLFLFG